MANKKVTLIRRCKTPDGWRQYPIAYGPKGKVKPGVVLVAGRDERGGNPGLKPDGHMLRTLRVWWYGLV